MALHLEGVDICLLAPAAADSNLLGRPKQSAELSRRFLSCKGPVEDPRHLLDHPFNLIDGPAASGHPPRVPFRSTRTAADEDRMILRGHQMNRPAHAPNADEGTVLPEGGLDIGRVKAVGPGPQRHLGGRQHLRLRPAHVSSNAYKVRGGQARREMMTREPKGRNTVRRNRRGLLRCFFRSHGASGTKRT
jgi:hypothetical protein